jgi:CRP-like cAMP-binding protein
MFRKLFSSVHKPAAENSGDAPTEKALLSDFPILKGADYSLISEIADAVESVHYNEGETIFEEGETGHSLFLVVSGSVSLISKGEPVAQIGKGGCFGEGALLTEQVRGATAIAQQEVALFELKKESFGELSDKYLKIRFRINALHEQRCAEAIKTSMERNLLQNAPFLATASDEILDELAQVMERKNFETGDILIEEGQEGTTFFIVEKGRVGVTKQGAQVAELGPGACIGEGSLLSNHPCSAKVTALTETSCFILRRASFRHFLARFPVFAKKIERIHQERNQN